MQQQQQKITLKNYYLILMMVRSIESIVLNDYSRWLVVSQILSIVIFIESDLLDTSTTMILLFLTQIWQ